jgi:DnaJ-class molecular chaperone
MTDFYSKLGVSQDASQDDIKKAYRSLANKHHPDKGGDQATFKDISVAYDTLSDPQKRQEYDMQQNGNPFGGFGGFGNSFGGAQHFHFNMHDIFGQHGSTFGHGFQQQRRNRDLNLQVQVTLAESFKGKQLDANFHLPSGQPQHVVINVPAGIDNGDTIRYDGLGDDSQPGIPRGNLNVTIQVLPDPTFKREGNDIFTTLEINPIEAMIGCTKTVKTITGSDHTITIKPGLQSGTEYAKLNAGFTNLHNRQLGRFVIVVNIKTPAVTNPAIIAQLQQISSQLS